MLCLLCLILNLILSTSLLLSSNNIEDSFIFDFLGAFHPLFVHLPIGLWFGFIIFLLIGTVDKTRHIFPFLKIISLSVWISSIFAFLTGLSLRLGGYDSDIVDQHLSAALVFIYLISFFYIYHLKERSYLNLWITSFIISLSIGYNGHLGSVITHGSLNDRIGKFFIKNEQIHSDDSSDNFFNAAVYPILDSKCIICHNNRRSQGGLNMMTEKSILHGGLSGSSIIIGSAESSEIIRRINLPHDDILHMPPNEPYVTDNEKEIIKWWINHTFGKKKT